MVLNFVYIFRLWFCRIVLSVNYTVVCTNFTFVGAPEDATFDEVWQNAFCYPVIKQPSLCEVRKRGDMAEEQYIVYLNDEDEDDLEMLTTALQNKTCIAAVHCYTTTPELIRQLASLPVAALPDLIVTDYYMPPAAQGELIYYIRSQRRMDLATLIVYTTLLQEVKKKMLLNQGVDAIFTKGNTTREIEDHVSTFCRIVAGKKLTA